MTNLALEVGSIVAQLAVLGIDHFVVPNLPDIGAVPESAGDPAAAAARTTGTLLFNAALEAEMERQATSLGVRIDRTDVFGIFDAMLLNAADFGFTNTSQPLNAAPAGADPDEYVFWDNIHPTTRSHYLVSAATRALVDPAAPIELVSWSIGPDRSLRQTWLADPEALYEILAGTEPGALGPVASFTGSPAYTEDVPAPGPVRGFYRTRRTAP
jgi:phospholipase/lecithinase/hemolysin